MTTWQEKIEIKSALHEAGYPWRLLAYLPGEVKFTFQASVESGQAFDIDIDPDSLDAVRKEIRGRLPWHTKDAAVKEILAIIEAQAKAYCATTDAEYRAEETDFQDRYSAQADAIYEEERCA